jgi:hypothetical protein
VEPIEPLWCRLMHGAPQSSERIIVHEVAVRLDDDVVIDGQRADVGSSTSFDDFYAQQWPHAFRLATLMTHDAEAGADIAQDVFANMSRCWATIERPGAYMQRALTHRTGRLLQPPLGPGAEVGSPTIGRRLVGGTAPARTSATRPTPSRNRPRVDRHG